MEGQPPPKKRGQLGSVIYIYIYMYIYPVTINIWISLRCGFAERIFVAKNKMQHLNLQNNTTKVSSFPIIKIQSKYLESIDRITNLEPFLQQVYHWLIGIVNCTKKCDVSCYPYSSNIKKTTVYNL